MAYDPAALPLDAKEERGHAYERDERGTEAAAKAHEPSRLVRGAYIEHPRPHDRLRGHNAHRLPGEPREADNDVACEELLHLEEVAVVHNFLDHHLHVIPFVRLVGYDRVQLIVGAAWRVVGRDTRRIIQVVRGEIPEEPPHC